MELSVPLKPENFTGGFILSRLAELGKLTGIPRPNASGYKVKKFAITHTVVGTQDLIRGLAVQYAGVADVAHLILLSGSPARSRRIASRSEALPAFAAMAEKSATSMSAAVPLERPADAPWLVNVNDAEASVSPKNLAKTINSLMATLRDGDVAAIDLARVDRRTPNPEHLVAVLRSLYSWRKAIPGWEDLHRFARANLASRNLDAERLLRGLDQ